MPGPQPGHKHPKHKASPHGGIRTLLFEQCCWSSCVVNTVDVGSPKVTTAEPVRVQHARATAITRYSPHCHEHTDGMGAVLVTTDDLEVLHASVEGH